MKKQQNYYTPEKRVEAASLERRVQRKEHLRPSPAIAAPATGAALRTL